MNKIFYIFFIVIILISCNLKKEDKSANNTKIRVGYLYEFAGASAAAIAKEKGFFEEENLDVELFEFFNGHAAVLSMISKEIDFAYYAVLSVKKENIYKQYHQCYPCQTWELLVIFRIYLTVKLGSLHGIQLFL